MKIKENFRRYKTKKLEAIEDKFEDKNNQWKASKIFNNLIGKRRKILNKLYEDADMNKLYFKYEGSTKDVNFIELNDLNNFLMEWKIDISNLMMHLKNKKSR